MNVIIGSVLIWSGALAVLWHIWRVDPGKLPAVLRTSVSTFFVMLPRMVIGLSGASFMADLLPRDVVAALFGPEQGSLGIVIATLAGWLTPGGPMVAFAFAATGMKAGAATGPVLAYVTAWSIVSLTRTLSHELPMLGARFMVLRIVISAPVPLILGLLGQAILA
jgi:uncharacterized membrane protein YraQ (UPF0718 family)